MKRRSLFRRKAMSNLDSRDIALPTKVCLSQSYGFSVFIPIPKKGSAKECSNYGTIALISHASKAIVKREQRAENHTLRNP